DRVEVGAGLVGAEGSRTLRGEHRGYVGERHTAAAFFGRRGRAVEVGEVHADLVDGFAVARLTRDIEQEPPGAVVKHLDAGVAGLRVQHSAVTVEGDRSGEADGALARRRVVAARGAREAEVRGLVGRALADGPLPLRDRAAHIG